MPTTLTSVYKRCQWLESQVARSLCVGKGLDYGLGPIICQWTTSSDDGMPTLISSEILMSVIRGFHGHCFDRHECCPNWEEGGL